MIFEPPSPCIGVCWIGPTGYCAGCYRTLDEIAEWSQASGDRKIEVIAHTHKRRLAEEDNLD